MTPSLTAKEQMIAAIAEKIISGQLKTGDKLPPERELAQMYHLSKSTVHLALAELEKMGFVQTNARHGTFIGNFAANGNIETLNLLIRFSGIHFDVKMIRDIMDMRFAIESKAIVLLCENLNEEKTKKLAAHIGTFRSMCGECTVTELAEELFAFHHDICVLCENSILPLLFNSFHIMSIAFWEEAIRTLGNETCAELMQGLFDTIIESEPEQAVEYLNREFELYIEQVNRR